MSWAEAKAEILANVSLASIAGTRSSRMQCPFHHSDALDMQLFHEDNRWKCWGRCQASGDIFDWYQLENGCDFKTSLKQLAEFAGISLMPSKERTEALMATQRFYHEELKNHPEVIAYLKRRGFSEELMFRRQIGYAPNKIWPDNVPVRALEQVGLIKPSGYGPWPWFRDMIVYPVYDKMCNQVQMQGRAFPHTEEDTGPKYLALGQDVEIPGRSIYQCLAGEEILRDKLTKWAFLCEGWPDRETLTAWSLPALGLFGNKGLEKHSHKLGHLEQLYVLLDPDEASQKKLLDQLYQLAMRIPTVDIRNIVMPGDLDLNDWARQGRSAEEPLDPVRDEARIGELREWARNAKPLVEELIIH